MGYINGCAKVGIFGEMPSGEELPMIVADCNCNGTAQRLLQRFHALNIKTPSSLGCWAFKIAQSAN